MEKIISKAATLLEALPYIQRFRSQIFVVKYGGSFMDSPDAEVRHCVARDVVFLEAVGINPVVVHGGGKAITRALETAGVKSAFVQGHRVTDAATAKIVDQVLSREINPEIVKARRESATPIPPAAPKNSSPRLTVDASGRLWLAVRSAHPVWWTNPLGTVWTEHVASFDGNAWTGPVFLAHTDNLLDNLALILALEGSWGRAYKDDLRHPLQKFLELQWPVIKGRG